MTPEQIADCQSRLHLFAENMFMFRKKAGLIKSWHQNIICEALEKVVIGKTTRLIINIPPRSGKTEIAVLNFIAWATGLFPQSEWIHVSYSKRLATNNAYGVREIMRNPEYQTVFPWIKIRDDSSAKDEFRTEQGGVIYATGAGGTITGRGAGGLGGEFAGAIIIDDIHKAADADSDVMRENAISWFSNTLESRKNSPETPIIIIGQRLHENDLPGWLLGGGNGEEWELLKIPAINEQGESFWPEQFPLDMLERMEAASPYVFAGQYMQEPSPMGGGDFKTDNIEIVDALPEGLRFVRGWDLAGATKKTSDYTASVKIGVKGGVIFIADVVRFRGGPDEVENRILQTARLDGGTLQSLPLDPGQAGIAQKRTISRLLSGHPFEFSPESGDKRTRAMPFAAQVNVGNVKMLRSNFAQEYLRELASFPMGAHDDMVDASSRAYNKAVNSAPSTSTNISMR